MKEFEILLALLSQVVAFVLLIIRLKYNKHSKVLLASLYVSVNFLIPVFSVMVAKIIGVPPKTALQKLEIILVVFNFLVILLFFQQVLTLSTSFLGFITIFFVLIWLIEFSKITEITERLPYSNLFMDITVVLLCFWYWFFVLRNIEIYITRSPYFWVTMGLFVLHFSDSAYYLPLPKEYREQLLLFSQQSIMEIVAYTFFSIGFWKTKKWVQFGYGK